MTLKSALGGRSIGERNTLVFYQRWSVGMKQRRRICYSAAQRSEIWDRRQAGESMKSIWRRFDRVSSSLFSGPDGTTGLFIRHIGHRLVVGRATGGRAAAAVVVRSTAGLNRAGTLFSLGPIRGRSEQNPSKKGKG